jgi:hypothetical protein
MRDIVGPLVPVNDGTDVFSICSYQATFGEAKNAEFNWFENHFILVRKSFYKNTVASVTSVAASFIQSR